MTQHIVASYENELRELDRKIAERLTRLAASARLPGFRPGKVPTTLLKKRYGSSVMGEVLEQAVSDSSAGPDGSWKTLFPSASISVK